MWAARLPEVCAAWSCMHDSILDPRCIFVYRVGCIVSHGVGSIVPTMPQRFTMCAPSAASWCGLDQARRWKLSGRVLCWDELTAHRLGNRAAGQTHMRQCHGSVWLCTYFAHAVLQAPFALGLCGESHLFSSIVVTTFDWSLAMSQCARQDCHGCIAAAVGLLPAATCLLGRPFGGHFLILLCGPAQQGVVLVVLLCCHG